MTTEVKNPEGIRQVRAAITLWILRLAQNDDFCSIAIVEPGLAATIEL